MDIKKNCFKYNEDNIIGSDHYQKCSDSLKFFKTSNPAKQPGAIKIKDMETNYVMQIVSTGVRPDNIYEAKMLLAPEVDLSSIKITVKGNNLRVNVCKPLNDFFRKQLPEISEKSALGDMVKRMMKHCENLLIPQGIDSGKVRAVVDNKHRMLMLTAPAVKHSKSKKNAEKS